MELLHLMMIFTFIASMDSTPTNTSVGTKIEKSEKKQEDRCFLDWVEYENSGKCYANIHKMYDYAKAREYCQSVGSDLVTINSEEEFRFIKYNLIAYNMDSWIGLKRIDDPSNPDNYGDHLQDYKWVDGSLVEFNAFADGYPKCLEGREDCIVAGQGYELSGVEWRNSNCYSQHFFICETAFGDRPNTSPVPPTKPPDVPCHDSTPEDGWIRGPVGSEFCFLFLDVSASIYGLKWIEARDNCITKGGQLASISSIEEQEFIIQHTDVIMRYMWIGLVRNSIDRNFVWVDESPVEFEYWAPGEPNDVSEMESCTGIYLFNGYWMDIHCTEKTDNILCKKPLNGTWPTKAPPEEPSGHCPEWASEYDGWCWKINGIEEPNHKNWSKAGHGCNEIDAGYQLASVHSSKEQAFLTVMLRSNAQIGHISEVWLGGSDIINQYLWNWRDQTDFNYDNWGFRQPDGFGSQHCLTMFTGNEQDNAGTWNDQLCNKLFPYVCKAKANPKYTKPPPRAMCSHPLYSDFHSFQNACYLWVDEQKSWDDAEADCAKKGAHLVSILDDVEDAYVQAYMQDSDAWLGLSNKKHTHKFMWSDGFHMTFGNWLEEPIHSPNLEICAKISAKNGMWEPQNSCNDALKYMCKYTTDVPPTDYPTGYCPQPWKDLDPHDPFCYLLDGRSEISWGDANTKCQHLGGVLASFHTSRQMETVSKLVMEEYQGIWIGLQADYLNQWKWVDGSPYDFIYWSESEPNHGNDEEMYCVEILNDDGKWNDHLCESGRGYICQKHRFSIPKPSTTSQPEPTLHPGTTSKVPDNNHDDGNKGGLSHGGVAAIVMFVLFLVLSTTIIVVILKRKEHNIWHRFLFYRRNQPSTTERHSASPPVTGFENMTYSEVTRET